MFQRTSFYHNLGYIVLKHLQRETISGFLKQDFELDGRASQKSAQGSEAREQTGDFVEKSDL